MSSTAESLPYTPRNYTRCDVRALLGRNLRAALRDAEWSEAELARRSGVSQKQVNNSCRGRTGTCSDIVCGLAEALGVPPGLLLWDGFESASPELRRALARLLASVRTPAVEPRHDLSPVSPDHRCAESP